MRAARWSRVGAAAEAAATAWLQRWRQWRLDHWGAWLDHWVRAPVRLLHPTPPPTSTASLGNAYSFPPAVNVERYTQVLPPRAPPPARAWVRAGQGVWPFCTPCSAQHQMQPAPRPASPSITPCSDTTCASSPGAREVTLRCFASSSSGDVRGARARRGTKCII